MSHLTRNDRLLSDEQIEHYAAIFIALNNRYALTKKHHFIFDDFLENPEQFEKAIHVYFANPALFINRTNDATIHLHIFLCYPAIIETALEADRVDREMLAVHAEHLLPKQQKAAQKIDLAEMAWLAEQIMAVFEQHHRVLMHGCTFVEPCTHYYRLERKQAGGKH